MNQIVRPRHRGDRGGHGVGGAQDLGDLGPGELVRDGITAGEHLANPRPAQDHAIVSAVRAGLGARHALARPAVEGVLELVRREAETFGAAELVEERLRVVGAVVVADPGRVPTDDEVRAAVVPAYLAVVDGLARSCVAHRAREDSEHHAIRRVVAVEQHPVALHPDLEGHVIALGHAGEGMQQQSVDLLERDLGQVLVSAVHRVACLESHHRRPAAVGERRARLGRRGGHISRQVCAATRTGPATTVGPCANSAATPGWAWSVVRYTSRASASRSRS